MQHRLAVPTPILPLLALALVLAAACGGASAPTPQRTPTPSTPAPTPTPIALAAAPIPSGAALNPKWAHTNPGRSVEIAVEAGEVVDAVQQAVIELEFDPRAIQIEGVTRGRFLGAAPRLVSQDISNRTGRGTITLSTDKPQSPTNAGTIATLLVHLQKDIAAGEYALTLKRVTFIYDDKREHSAAAFTATVAVSLLPTPVAGPTLRTSP